VAGRWAGSRGLGLVVDADIIRVQDVDLRTADDPTILKWAARTGRVLLSHDRETMVAFVNERVAAGLSMPGAFIVSTGVSLSVVIDQIAAAAVASDPGEWADRATFVPWH
jgi:hypothetical protein